MCKAQRISAQECAFLAMEDAQEFLRPEGIPQAQWDAVYSEYRKAYQCVHNAKRKGYSARTLNNTKPAVSRSMRWIGASSGKFNACFN